MVGEKYPIMMEEAIDSHDEVGMRKILFDAMQDYVRDKGIDFTKELLSQLALQYLTQFISQNQEFVFEDDGIKTLFEEISGVEQFEDETALLIVKNHLKK